MAAYGRLQIPDMIRLLLKNIFFFALLAAFLSSCSAGRGTTKTDPRDSGNFLTQRVSSYKALEFDRYFYEGIKERDNGNFQRAAEQFEKAADTDPSKAAAFYELGRCLVQLGQIGPAENAGLSAVKLQGDNKWYMVFLADVYEQEKKWPQAMDIYSKLVAKYPNEPDYYINLAELDVQENKVPDAMKVYDDMEKQFGMNEDIIVQKYKVYYQLEKYDKAIEEISKLVALQPGNIKYRQLLADAYMKAGQNDKALAEYQNILNADPNDGNTQLALSEFYYEQGEKDKGFDLLKKAFANSSLSIDQKVAILYSYFLMKDNPSEENRKQAYDLTEILVKTHPNDAKSHAIYGDFLYQDKKYPQAREEYLKSIAARNDVFAVWQQLFYVDSELKNYKDLASDAAKALDVFPSQPSIYFFSGIAKNELKQYSEAISDFQTGASLTVDNVPLEVQFYLNMAEAYNNLKQYPESDAAFEHALKLDPENALALNNYAYYLSVRNENLDKAEEMAKKALVKEPNNASYLDTYGWILYKRGKYKEAAEYVKKSLDQDAGDATVTEHYGDIMFKLGDAESAVTFWKKARQLGATSEKLDKEIADKKLYE
jgi:tetratricopeptide (TPR) repeat protein